MLTLATVHTALLHARGPNFLETHARIKMAVSKTSFAEWAKDSGIESPKLQVQYFGDTRGVGARENLQTNERILAVPSGLALQVTTSQRAPRWIRDENTWRVAPWYQRLALTLLHEEATTDSQLKPWLAELPREFCTPIFWSDSQLDELGYPPMVDAVQKQRAEWEQMLSKLQSSSPSGLATDRDSLFRALSVVRSRSFSGPYASGTFKGSLIQLFLASTLAGVYTVTGVSISLTHIVRDTARCI